MSVVECVVACDGMWCPMVGHLNPKKSPQPQKVTSTLKSQKSQKSQKKVKKIRKKFSDLEKNAFFDLIVGNKEKNEENNEVSSLNRASFSFTSIFSDWPPLNRKS